MKALDKETLELIDRLLSGYEIALENILYKNNDPTERLAEIAKARAAIVQRGPEIDKTLCDCGKKPKELGHTCPFAEEIGGDSETLCNCCSECQYQCAMDI